MKEKDNGLVSLEVSRATANERSPAFLILLFSLLLCALVCFLND